MDIYPAREKQEDYPEVSSKNIIDLLENGDSISDETWDKLIEDKDSVILFMSPKQITTIMEKYKDYLKNEEQE